MSQANSHSFTEGTIWLNGEMMPIENATLSIMDHGILYGDGVFEGLRAYNNRIIKCATHLQRFADSAHTIRMNLPYSLEALDAAMREVLKINHRNDGYLRLCATRGVGSMGLNPFLSPTPSIFIISCDLKLYPQEMYDNGMAIITSHVARNLPTALSPRIKSNNYLNNILAKIDAIDAGVQEAIMLNNQGMVAECTGDNLFIFKNGKLLTPPTHAGILEGVTRNLVIDLAQEVDIETQATDLTLYDVYCADECFLTGTAAEIIPVTSVDKRTIGNGRCGKQTQTLIDAFRALIVAGVPED